MPSVPPRRPARGRSVATASCSKVREVLVEDVLADILARMRRGRRALERAAAGTPERDRARASLDRAYFDLLALHEECHKIWCPACEAIEGSVDALMRAARPEPSPKRSRSRPRGSGA